MQNVFKWIAVERNLKSLPAHKQNMPEIIDGEKIAEELMEDLEDREIAGKPELQIVQVGENKASEVFIERKKEACRRLGFGFSLEKFPETVGQKEVTEFVEQKNSEDDVDGVLVQLPLPEHIDNNSVFEALSPEKDVDCLTPENLGKLLRGNPRIKPCAVEGIEEILEREEIEMEGKDIAVVNNSNLIGKPLTMDLTNKGATLTLCNEKTEDLARYSSEADIIVTATGEEGLIEEDMISEDAVVIDAGYSYSDGEISQETENLDRASKLSSVPGGLGPITVVMTMKNLLKCFERQN